MNLEQRTQGIMAKRRRTAEPTSSEPITAFSEGQSRLELLPDEIHLIIFNFMVTTHSAVHTKNRQRYRAALHNLCLVSKRMDVLGRQALYSDISLYSHDRAIRLCATLLTYPKFTGYVKSIIFFPSQDDEQCKILTADLRCLQGVNDPDFNFWTTGGNLAKVRMPEVTRDQMAYNLLFKVLPQTPALEALYIRLPKHHGRYSDQVFRRTASYQCLRELDLQHRLFEQASPPELPRLRTVGILGGGLHWRLRDSLARSHEIIPFFKSLLRSPNLVEVCWAGLPRAHALPELWDAPLITGQVGNVPARSNHFVETSTSVKTINIQSNALVTRNIRGLAKAFPSVESITVEDGCSLRNIRWRRPAVPHLLFNALGQFDHLHTLVLDNDPAGFGTDHATDTGVDKRVDLSALRTLQALVVPLDLFAYFTLGENRIIQLATTILPGSLRRLTLLLDTECRKRLASLMTRKFGVEGVLREFMLELATTFLVDFPHLNKIEVCSSIEHYRQYKVNTVFTFAGRPATGTS